MEKENTTIQYLGWSNFIIRSPGGQIAFDPFWRSTYGTRWATQQDFAGTGLVLISHGHNEHYLDTPKVAKQFGPQVIAPDEVLDHLQRHKGVDAAKLLYTPPFQKRTVGGYEVTPVPWHHREVGFFAYIRGDYITGLKFSLCNKFLSPHTTTYYGYHIKTPCGTGILNLNEGMNSLLTGGEIERLKTAFPIDVLIGGAQLRLVDEVARIADALNPRLFIMHHPHKALFDRIKLPSKPPQDFIDAVKQKRPEMEIVYPDVAQTISL